MSGPICISKAACSTGFEFQRIQVLENFELSSIVCFVALRPKSTAMVIAGRSVHLITLFPGQA